MKTATKLIGLGILLISSNVAVAQEQLKIEVTTTGAHPSGTQWDGVRLFLLPFEATTVSPPEIEICIVQDDTRCAGQVGQSWHPACPDSDKCRFAISLDTSRPFGVVVFDIDTLADGEVAAAAGAISGWAGAVTALPQADWSKDIVAGVGDFLSASSAGLESINAHRLEWMDAIVISPDEQVAGKDLSDRMRLLARTYERPPPFASHSERLAGPFDIQPIETCEWPGPACLLNYTTIQFFREETNNAD